MIDATERAEKRLAEEDGLLVVGHVRALLEPDERLAARRVEAGGVAGDHLGVGPDVVATLEERDRDLDARDGRSGGRSG